MSNNTLLNTQELYNRIDLLITKMSHSYHMKNRFDVGEGYDRKTFIILNKIQKSLCRCGVLEEKELEYINKITL